MSDFDELRIKIWKRQGYTQEEINAKLMWRKLSTTTENVGEAMIHYIRDLNNDPRK